MAKSPWDFIKDLTSKKTKWEDISESDRKAFSPYMNDLVLSMDPDLLPIVNYFQKYTIEVLKPREVYKLYRDILPTKIGYSKYIKATKAEKYTPELVDIISKYYLVSKRISIEYIDMMSKEELESVVAKYGKTKKEITQIMKGKK
jgi:hypothetical protein